MPVITEMSIVIILHVDSNKFLQFFNSKIILFKFQNFYSKFLNNFLSSDFEF